MLEQFLFVGPFSRDDCRERLFVFLATYFSFMSSNVIWNGFSLILSIFCLFYVVDRGLLNLFLIFFFPFSFWRDSRSLIYLVYMSIFRSVPTLRRRSVFGLPSFTRCAVHPSLLAFVSMHFNTFLSLFLGRCFSIYS